MKQIGVDFIALDRFTATEDEKTLTIPNAVIAREIVHRFRDEMIYKPADEIYKSTVSAAKAWLTEVHPEPFGLITENSQIRGSVKEPRFKNNGIYADLVLFKDYCSQVFLEDVKQGTRNQLSIGYFYKRDETSGTWKGKHYDSIQRGIFIDHVAVISERARCPPPYCGIGVDQIAACIAEYERDEMVRRGILGSSSAGWTEGDDIFNVYIGGDPWEETENEIRQRVRDPGRYADKSFRRKEVPGTKGIYMIVACPKGQWTGSRCDDGMQLQAYRFDKRQNWTMEKAKAWYKEHARDTLKAFEMANVKCDVDLDDFLKSWAEVERLAAQDQERERKRAAAKRRSARYHIGVKPGGNLSPPKGYPTSPAQYGDPVNFRYPLIPKSRAYAALRYFAKPANRRQYSRREQLIIWERIVRGCLRYNIMHRYDPDNPLDRGLPASLKRRLPGYED